MAEPRSDLERIRADLDAARADLLAALDGVTQEQFVRRPPGEVTEQDERWPIRDVLWHVGYSDDWTRRMIDQGLAGGEVPAWERRRRPAYLNTPELLREWLEQSRRPTLSLLRRLTDGDLDREVTLRSGRTRTVRLLLEEAAEHDREHAKQVRALRNLPAPPER